MGQCNCTLSNYPKTVMNHLADLVLRRSDPTGPGDDTRWVQLNLQHSYQAALDKGNGLFVRTL